MRTFYILLFILINVTSTFAQKQSPSERETYVKVITERAGKITAVLGINDAKKAEKVTGIIRDQYSSLNDVYAARDAKYKAIKETNKDNKILQDTLIAQENRKVEASLAKLHQKYLKNLATQLNTAQIEKVKDGMTYGVVPLTYRAYQEQLLNLTAEQKKQILVWLTEAREKAMDAESADKKHATFGKYKGRINNYLSAQGYDLKKEGIEWQKRIKAAQEANKNANKVD
ncbi:MAG: DUF3826 domain-containing protein [Bacteroidota bacterium]